MFLCSYKYASFYITMSKNRSKNKPTNKNKGLKSGNTVVTVVTPGEEKQEGLCLLCISVYC